MSESGEAEPAPESTSNSTRPSRTNSPSRQLLSQPPPDLTLDLDPQTSEPPERPATPTNLRKMSESSKKIQTLDIKLTGAATFPE